MDAQSEERVRDLAKKLGAAVDEAFVCRRSVPGPFDATRDQVMISLPVGLWSGWERIDGANGPKRLLGRLHAWQDVGVLRTDTKTGHSNVLGRTVTEIELEIPALGEGEIGLVARYLEDQAIDSNQRTLEFIQSCLRRKQAVR